MPPKFPRMSCTPKMSCQKSLSINLLLPMSVRQEIEYAT